MEGVSLRGAPIVNHRLAAVAVVGAVVGAVVVGGAAAEPAANG